MTTPNPKEALEPCPFCGGEAERIDVPSVGNDPELGGDPNAGGSCIQCKRCAASTALHFDRKEHLYSSWNDCFMAGVAEQSGAGAPETSVRCGAPAALAALPPAGEKREAIARIIDPFAYHAYDLHKVEAHRGRTGFVDKDGEPTNYAVRRGVIAARVIADAILASGLVQDEAGWRDISSAPKDGSWFLICNADDPEFFGYEVGRYDPYMTTDYVETEAGSGLYRAEKRSSYDWQGFNNFHHATHWMPLPTPPIRSARDGGEG